MKKILSILATLALSLSGYAQDYYTGKEVVHTQDRKVAYCVHYLSDDSFFLYNSTNVFRETRIKYNDGRELEAPLDIPNTMLTSIDVAYKIFQDNIPADVRANIRAVSDNITVFCYVLSDGNSSEVDYLIHTHPALLAVSPDVWYRIEQEIKQKIKWSLKDYQKVYNYLPMGFEIQTNKL